MARSRKANLPIDSSWRMVEGENDSFDTTVIRNSQNSFDDDFMSSGPSQLTSSSQVPASQDSIRDFADKADDERVILRAPFQPSLASTLHSNFDKERTPVPEFFMPTVGVNNQHRSTSTRSSRTIRPTTTTNDSSQIRRRLHQDQSRAGNSNQHETQEPYAQGKGRDSNSPPNRQSLVERFSIAAPEFLFNCLSWILSVLGMALHFSKWPLAVVLAFYLTIGASIMVKNMVTQSASVSLQPFCRIPGASLFNLPFCPDDSHVLHTQNGAQHIEFDELMNVQSQFEQVLEDSAQGVSIPMEMKRAEASVRDLRTMVKVSDLPARDELIYEFNGYVDTVGQISNDLQLFNTRVGGAVDSIISINRWTSRYIDSVAANREANDNLLSRSIDWLFSPFQPAVFDDRMVLDKYIEHTAFVSEKVSTLIIDAHALLRLLSQGEDHLQTINEIVVRSGNAAKEKHSEVLWNLWTLVGANNRRLHKLNAQLALLKQVDKQRHTAVSQLTGLVHDLGDIQTKLADLRERVAAPELLADSTSIPLSVHIETINAGVERLEVARSRIREEENERLQQALARSRSRDEDRLIEG